MNLSLLMEPLLLHFCRHAFHGILALLHINQTFAGIDGHIRIRAMDGKGGIYLKGKHPNGTPDK